MDVDDGSNITDNFWVEEKMRTLKLEYASDRHSILMGEEEEEMVSYVHAQRPSLLPPALCLGTLECMQ